MLVSPSGINADIHRILILLSYTFADVACTLKVDLLFLQVRSFDASPFCVTQYIKFHMRHGCTKAITISAGLTCSSLSWVATHQVWQASLSGHRICQIRVRPRNMSNGVAEEDALQLLMCAETDRPVVLKVNVQSAKRGPRRPCPTCVC